MNITTWNVNSLKVRLPQVLDWLDREHPDILCLQETKIPDDQFPVVPFQEKGYHPIFSGQPTYNGVAILSKQPAQQVENAFPSWEDAHRRFLSAVIGGIRIVNIYVPNGQDLDSPKFPYKLEWLAQLQTYMKQFNAERDPVLLLGDFNIVSGDLDTWDPEGMKDQIFLSEPERSRMKSLFDLGYKDLFRMKHPDLQAFSWWDYRMGSFHRNHGLRIDLILASRPLAARCEWIQIGREARKNERPSDHAPVTAGFTE
ncbi:MAG: exodeoxyribonuclease III [Leptospirales bacterium]